MGNKGYYLLLPVAESLDAAPRLLPFMPACNTPRTLYPRASLKLLNSRHEKTVLDLAVREQVVATRYDIEEGRVERTGIGERIMLQEKILEFVELLDHTVMFACEITYGKFLVAFPLEKLVNIRENHRILIFHVAPHFLHIFVEETYSQHRHIAELGQHHPLHESFPDAWKCEVQNVGVGLPEICHQSGETHPEIFITPSGYQIGHRKKCLRINIDILTYILYRAVAESEGYPESIQHQKQVAVTLQYITYTVICLISRVSICHVLILEFCDAKLQLFILFCHT